MKRNLSVLLIAVLAITFSTGFTYRPIEELGSQEITNLSASTALTVEAGTQHIEFTIRHAGVHVSRDGTAATTADQYIHPGVYKVSNDYRLIPLLRFINSSDGSATLYVVYTRTR